MGRVRIRKGALPWRVFMGCPACIQPVFRVYPTLSLVSRCIPCIYLHLTILQQIHCIPLYLTVSSSICTYLAVSSCIPFYLTVSHRLKNRIEPKIRSRGGLKGDILFPDQINTHKGVFRFDSELRFGVEVQRGIFASACASRVGRSPRKRNGSARYQCA